MTKFTSFLKTYATGALLLVVLLSPLQSSAAMMTTNEVNALRDQVAQVSEAVESAPGIPMQKRSELRAVIETINNLIALLALQTAADPDAMYQRPTPAPFEQGDVFTGNEASFFSDLIIQ